MLSLAQCSRLLGQPVDQEGLRTLREQFYALADVVVSEFSRTLIARENPPDDRPKLAEGIAPDRSEAIEERAAILEFEAGYSRDEAERAALTGWIRSERRGR